MSDIIKLLPETVANQIAAGEVIQRPASVIKELMENAIDAGASDIKVIIKDSGSTLIQIIDNASGMSELDARMAFERHATSKISSAKDLFNLRTNGFRGEALASIAAIAQVELKTKRVEDELGTLLIISGSTIEKQEGVMCTNGSNMMVKNLFFNVPARRRFLKKNEFTYIDNEFKRIALTYPEISMSLTHNDSVVHNLTVGNLRQRIVKIFGQAINSKLISINSDTSIATITGFVGTPESAKKKRNEQYFFVNGRYMKHAYFNKAVSEAYGRLIAPDTFASYFIFFEVEPETIDVNVHPQKIEIKFENERSIFPILMATVKEAIGKFSLATQIDFDQMHAPDIPVMTDDTEIKIPKVSFNSSFNPFQRNTAAKRPAPETSSENWINNSNNDMPQNDDFLEEMEPEETVIRQSIPSSINAHIPEGEPVQEQQVLDIEPAEDFSFVVTDNVVQLLRKYIIAESNHGILLIDQKYAHERIIFEDIKTKIGQRQMTTQKIIFPEPMQYDHSISKRFDEILPLLTRAGFDIESQGNGNFELNGMPSEIANHDGIAILEQILEKAEVIEVDVEINEIIAETLSMQSAVKHGQELSKEEMKLLIKRLMKCQAPSYSPKGYKTMRILSENDLINLI